jgi:hypothetical protein
VLVRALKTFKENDISLCKMTHIIISLKHQQNEKKFYLCSLSSM